MVLALLFLLAIVVAAVGGVWIVASVAWRTAQRLGIEPMTLLLATGLAEWPLDASPARRPQGGPPPHRGASGARPTRRAPRTTWVEEIGWSDPLVQAPVRASRQT